MLGYLDSKPNLPEHLMEKLTWILPYRAKVQKWRLMQVMANSTIKVVLEVGYQKDTVSEWKKSVAHINKRSSLVRETYDGLKHIIEIESIKVPVGDIYTGCSSIIESIFGKFKTLEVQFSSSGLTELVLAIPALAGKITHQDIYEAMSSIHLNDVKDWIDENIGETYLSKRRTDLLLN